MKQILAIAIGGSIGALLRFWAANAVHTLTGRDFPYGTLLVNVSGSLLMGLLYVLLVERFELGAEWRAALLIGVLGAYTTFSSFSIETFTLFESGEHIRALMNIVLSVTLCLLAVWLGVMAGRKL